jgi:hypothetical protein
LRLTCGRRPTSNFPGAVNVENPLKPTGTASCGDWLVNVPVLPHLRTTIERKHAAIESIEVARR